MSGAFTFAADLLSEDCLTALPGVRLSRLSLGDAGPMAAGLNDLDVARNLVAVPHPYAEDDAAVFLKGPAASPEMLCAALKVDGAFAGCVAIDATSGPPELGYWLAKPHWGRGVMSAATRALVDFAFAATDIDRIVSGHFVDNVASAAVLKKLGFKPSGLIETRSRARSEPVRLVAMALEREAWASARPSIGTARLVMRPPTLGDIDDMATLATEAGLPLTTAATPEIRRRDDARAFVTAEARRPYPDEASFCMRLRETGALVGGVGWRRASPDELELGYWLGADHRGVGLAAEAARAALDAAFEATGVASVKACCRVTNSASRGVLERCGFQWAGAGHMRAQGSAGPAPVDRFRVDREVFYSLKAWGAAATGAA
jgi:RimJ/RimL family protein N-acetyltransferase